MAANARRADVAIIGAGTAGLAARRAAKKAGATVIMIDAGPLGTTCARVGCMPSKLFVAAANAAYQVRRAPIFGVYPKDVHIDGPAVLKRLRAERDRFVASVLTVIDQAKNDGEFIQGNAKVQAPGELRVSSGPTVHFDRLIVATGSSSIVPAPFRGMGGTLLTSDDVFELNDLPRSVAVVGLGSVGLELGQALHRLGVRTTLLGMGGGIGPLTDPEIVASARAVLGAELDLHPDYELESWKLCSEEFDSDSGVVMHFTDSYGVKRTETYDKVVIAAGRRANLDGLGLEHYGVSLRDGSYPVHPGNLQLADIPVFIAGDANAHHPLLHEAADDGRIAGKNAASYPAVDAPGRRVALRIVFCEPQVAIVGENYKELAQHGVVAGAVDYADQGRSRVQAINEGRARIYADKTTGQLLGGELFAPRAEHLAHLLSWAVQQKLTVEQALGMPFYHPVVEEGLRTALHDLAANQKHVSRVACQVTESGVGS